MSLSLWHVQEVIQGCAPGKKLPAPNLYHLQPYPHVFSGPRGYGLELPRVQGDPGYRSCIEHYENTLSRVSRADYFISKMKLVN